MDKRMNRPEEEVVKQYLPGFMIFRLYRARNTRPKDRKRSKIYYTGKKKKHTTKNLHTVNELGLNLQIKTLAGRQVGRLVGDTITKYTRRIILFSQKMLLIHLIQDSWAGSTKRLSKAKPLPIRKKEKNQKDLTEEEKEYNKDLKKKDNSS